MTQYTAIHCFCAVLGNLLVLMTTIFKVIQSYTHLPHIWVSVSLKWLPPFKRSSFFQALYRKPQAENRTHLVIFSPMKFAPTIAIQAYIQQVAGGLWISLLVQHQWVLLVSWEILYREGCNRSVLQTLLLQVLMQWSKQNSVTAAADSWASPCTKSLLISSNTCCKWKTVGATEQTQPPKSKAVHGCLKLCFLRQCTTLLHLPQSVFSNHIHHYTALLSVILWNYSLKPKARGFLGGKIKEQWNDVSRSQSKTDARGGKLRQRNTITTATQCTSCR